MREEIDEQLCAAYDMIRKDRFGINRKTMAEWVLALLPPYMEDRVIYRNRGVLSRSGELLGRYYYLRAAALWLTGEPDEARQAYAKAVKLFASCDEKELCDGIGL